MKVIVTESRIGIEYLSDVISTCDQNGIECIVDDKNGDIYYYDPKRRKYGDDRLLHDNDASIWDIVKDRKLFDDIMFDASGAIFKDFAVKWNDLQKKSDEDEVYKTKICNSIRGNFSESRDNPNDWSASEGEVEIMWDTDEYEDFGIFKGEGSTYLVDYDRVDTHDDLINEVCRMIGKEYPDLDFDPSDFVIVNEDEFWEQRGGNPGKWEDDDQMFTEDEDDVASALAEELGIDAKRDVVEKEDGEYDYFSPEHTFGVKLPDGSDATYIVYGNEESATTSAADDLGERFRDDAPILGAAIEYFGIDHILKYISGLDDEEMDELASLYDDLGKEEFAEYIQNRVDFDYRGFAEFNIEELGPAWHLAEYDGQELELPNGMLAYRVN